MKRRSLLGGCALALVATLGATACSSDSTSSPTTGSSSPASTEPTASSATASTTGDTATSVTATDDTATSETATGDTATADTATGDTATGDTTSPDAVLTAPFPTFTTEETFVDTSRTTSATADAAELPSRTLPTTIIAPEAPGPFPLIILNHGLVGSSSKLSRLATAWATAGYVVALPTFPLTSDLDPDVIAHENDVVNQPGDVSFVIDKVLAMNDDDSSALFGRIDAAHIGVAGHSLGAATVYGIALNTCCLDERIGAAIVMSGIVEVSPSTADYSRQLPVLILHADTDPELPIAGDQAVYDELAGPKWFITLLGGDHTTGYENPDSPYNDLVAAATTDFLNQYLAAVPGSLDALRADAVVNGLSTLQTNQ